MKFLTAVLIISVLSGCSTAPKVEVNKDKAYIESELSTLLTNLAEKAVEIKTITMKHQAAMARLNAPAGGYQDVYNNVPSGLEQVIPMPYFYGDAEEPLKLIAKLTNYRFTFRGAKPRTMTWVQISEQERPAIETIEDIANQIDKNSIDVDVWATPDSEFKGVIAITYPGANE